MVKWLNLNLNFNREVKHRDKILKSCISLFVYYSADKAAFNLTIYLKVKTLLKKFHILDKLIFGCKPKKTVVCIVFGYVRTAD